MAYIKGKEILFSAKIGGASSSGSGSGGNLNINGTVKQYKVEAGENVNSGDFVEFVSTLGAGQFSSNAKYVASCSISPERKIVLYTDSIVGATMAQVVDIGDTITFGEPTPIIQQTAYPVYIAALNATTIIAGANLTLQAFTLNGDTITLGEAYTLEYRLCSLVGLNDHLFAVAWGAKVNSRDAYANILLFSYDGAYTKIDEKQGISVGNNFSTSITNDTCCALVKLNESHLFAISCAYNASTDRYSADVFAFTESGLSNIQRVTNSCEGSKAVLACKLTEDTICAVLGGVSGSLTRVLHITLPLSTSAIYLQEIEGISYRAALTAISEDKVLMIDDVNKLTMLQIESTTVARLSSYNDASIASAPARGSLEPIGNNNFILFSDYGGSGGFMTVQTNDDVITLDKDTEAERGTFVRRATSNSHSIGIAKTSGEGGATIEVYRAV